MKNLYLVVSTFFIFNFCLAQQVPLKIILVQDQGAPVINATGILVNAKDNSVKKTFILKDSMTMAVEINTDYNLSLTSAGKKKLTQFIPVKEEGYTVYMSFENNTTNLDMVVVTARKPLITQEDDKTIIDAEPLANSSTNAFEILEKTPGAIIDQDGNVYLSSTTPATIYINGREMKLSNADVASLLKSLPAGSVSKIEILRSPSAKFDAASSGGIVNIVLKKGVKIGLNGSVNASYFQGKYATESAGVSINNSDGKANSYFSYQFTNRNNFESLLTKRFIPSDSASVDQNSYTVYPMINNYIGGGIDYQFTDKLSLAYDLNLSLTNSNSSAASLSKINNGSGNLLANNRSDITNDNNTAYFGNSLSSKYKIDSTGSELTAEINYNYYNYNGTQEYNNQYFLPQRDPLLGKGDNKNIKNIFVAKTDFTYKFPLSITLETGIKITSSNSNNSALYFRAEGNGPAVKDSFQTNTFNYKENITAAYIQAAKTYYGFTLKPGLRLESTDIQGNQTIPADTNFAIKRTDVFPYIFLKHKLWSMFGTDLIGSAIYRKSISRPYYEALNPYAKYIDQYLFERGNPSLRPQFTTNYEFNVTFDNFPVFAIGINKTKDIFSNVTYQDPVTKIAYRTFDNLGKNKEFYFRLVGGIPPGKKFFFYVGAQHNFNEYNGFYQNQPLNYKRGSWTFFMYQEYKITNTLLVNTQGFLRTSGIQNFYELKNFGGLFLSVNKAVFNKKMNIILSVNDLLKTNQVQFTLDQPGVYATGSRINDTRKLGLKLRYNFGLKKQNKDGKAFGAPIEGAQ